MDVGLLALVLSTTLQWANAIISLGLCVRRSLARYCNYRAWIWCWWPMSTAFFLMAIRRTVTLVHCVVHQHTGDPTAEFIALMISLLMCSGLVGLWLRMGAEKNGGCDAGGD